MDSNFRIEIGDGNIPFQLFNGRKYRLYPTEKYFKCHRWYMHQDVWKFHNGTIPKGFHVHHKDGNRWNNELSNLELKEANKHLSEHVKKRFAENPEFVKQFYAKGIEAAKQWHKSPEGIEWHRKHAEKCKFGQKRDWGVANCLQCGKEFNKNTSHAKFCHPNCKAKNLRERRKLDGKCL